MSESAPLTPLEHAADSMKNDSWVNRLIRPTSGQSVLITLASSLAAAEPVQRALGVVYLQETSRTVDLEMHRPKLEVLQLQPPIQREYLAIGGSRSPVRRSRAMPSSRSATGSTW